MIQTPLATGERIARTLIADDAAIELTIVIPTYNERENVWPLISRIRATLIDRRWEIIVVDDDSGDGTANQAKAAARLDSRIQCIRRVGRRGLAGAVIEGALASAAPFIAVMDADLQHDEKLLCRMLSILEHGECDLVVASRYLASTPAPSGLSPIRLWGSRIANRLAQHVLKAEVSDPVSGFFAIRRDAIDVLAPRLSSTGFKVLFDIIATARGGLRIREVAYKFSPRLAGESKLDGKVAIDYLGLVLSKLTRDVISPRALMFALVGFSGVMVHLTVLRLALGAGFAQAQLLGALAAMTSNYLINNAMTYRDRRRTGLDMFGGYVRFCLLCAIGLIANLAVANLVREQTHIWWLAGVAGAGVGASWNYLTTALAVW